MNKKILKALKGSIKKWEDIVNKTGIDQGTSNCPLCWLFYYNNGCKGCPTNCNCFSIYYNWYQHGNNTHGTAFEIKCSDCLILAQAELDHLKSLFPEETK